MKSKCLIFKTFAVGIIAAFALSAHAERPQMKAEMKAAMDKCQQEHPTPARPGRGTAPTEDQRQAMTDHMNALKDCMETAGFTLPDRPQRARGSFNGHHQPYGGGGSSEGAAAAR